MSLLVPVFTPAKVHIVCGQAEEVNCSSIGCLIHMVRWGSQLCPQSNSGIYIVGEKGPDISAKIAGGRISTAQCMPHLPVQCSNMDPLLWKLRSAPHTRQHILHRS